MQNENRLLSPAALLFVIAAHALLFWLLASIKPPELPAEPPGLSFVDLGEMGGGGGGGTGGDTIVENEPPAGPPGQTPPEAPKPEQPKPERPKPQPVKPVPEQRAQIKPVERRDKPADIVQPKPVEPKPEPKPQPLAQPRPEPKPQPEQPIAPASPNAGHSANAGGGKGTPSAGEGGGSGGGKGSGTGPGEGSGRGPGKGGGEGGGEGGGIGSGKGPGTGQGGGGDSAPTHLGGYLHNPKPPYPADLEDRGISGTVKLRVMVEANGKPSSVEVLSATRPEFARSAEKTVRERFTFVPAKRNGQPVRQSYTFTLRFTAP